MKRFTKHAAMILLVIFLAGLTPIEVFANHQMSFSTDKIYYIQGKENVVLTVQDTDNDGAMIGWDGIAIYDANNVEVANYDDNTVGQGHPIQAGQNLVWNWNQKYDVRAGKQNANNNVKQVPLGTYYGLAKTSSMAGGNQKNYQTQNFVIDSDKNNNGVADSLDDDDNDGVANHADACLTQSGSKDANGCPDADGDGVADSKDKCSNEKEDKNGFEDDDGCSDAARKNTKDTLNNIALGVGVVAGVFFYLAAAASEFPPAAAALAAVGVVLTLIALAIGYVANTL